MGMVTEGAAHTHGLRAAQAELKSVDMRYVRERVELLKSKAQTLLDSVLANPELSPETIQARGGAGCAAAVGGQRRPANSSGGWLLGAMPPALSLPHSLPLRSPLHAEPGRGAEVRAAAAHGDGRQGWFGWVGVHAARAAHMRALVSTAGQLVHGCWLPPLASFCLPVPLLPPCRCWTASAPTTHLPPTPSPLMITKRFWPR